MNKRAFFTSQLAYWFFEVEWHYKTLLSVSIECVADLPDDVNALIDELLLKYPARPSQRKIASFLNASERLCHWFDRNSIQPTMTRFTLQHTNANTAIEKPFPTLTTVGDLAQWLSVTSTELDWFANCWRDELSTPKHLQHYQYHIVEKRSGGMRLIEQPKVELKRIQRRINELILNNLDTHAAAHGFCRGRNCVSHASNHVGKRYLITYDIADCFHSIDWPVIKNVFRRIGYSEQVSFYLAALCSHRVQLDYKSLRQFTRAQRSRLIQRHLPQGAPTSPALANAALHQLDVRLTGLANSLEMDYSRYADDIAMSSNVHRDWRFLESLIGGICLEEGVSLNHRKTRTKRPHQKQRLVGIVVNTKPNIDRQYYDTLKATLTNCKKFGLESQNREGHLHFRAQLLGRIQYVKSLSKNKGEKLERIYRDIA
ncbi:MAG: reverse transcriptase family protein [Granulosicoccus sp.]